MTKEEQDEFLYQCMIEGLEEDLLLREHVGEEVWAAMIEQERYRERGGLLH